MHAMASNDEIRAHITELVAEERRLREQLASGEVSPADEQARLKDLETELDQLWDLLRQRQAKQEFGEDPDTASERSTSTVEGYLN